MTAACWSSSAASVASSSASSDGIGSCTSDVFDWALSGIASSLAPQSSAATPHSSASAAASTCRPFSDGSKQRHARAGRGAGTTAGGAFGASSTWSRNTCQLRRRHAKQGASNYQPALASAARRLCACEEIQCAVEVRAVQRRVQLINCDLKCTMVTHKPAPRRAAATGTMGRTAAMLVHEPSSACNVGSIIAA